MDTEHWASYHRSGALISCPTNPEPYYTMEVHDSWERFFSGLVDGDRVLDLGTGNGPVALIAKETADSHSWHYEIDAVDVADIDPHKFVPDGARLLKGIRFHGGVKCEDLPFDNQQFDAISGQYILEYTDKHKTMAECARVMVPGARCQFILHHLDSVIVRNALQSLQEVDLVVDTEAIPKFRDYCETVSGSAGGAQQARAALYEVGETLQAAANEAQNPLILRFVIDYVSALLARRSQMRSGELQRETVRLETEFESWARRLRDLASAAVSQEEMDALVEMANASGFFAVETGEQFQADQVVGWRLTMFRSR